MTRRMEREAWQSMMGLEVHEACTTGDRDSLEDYLSSGKYDPNMRDPEWGNRTALHWACGKGYVDCMRLLLEHGANGTSRMDMGWTPAHCAAESGKLNALKALHAAGVSVRKKDKYGDRPLRVAAMYRQMDCVKFLRQVEQEYQVKVQEAENAQVDTDSDYESSEEGNEA